MSIHRGEKVRSKVKERGMPITVFCDRLDISRSTAYNWFDDDDLPIEYLIRCSKVLDFDFLADLDTGVQVQNTVAEQEPVYGLWKDKYYTLLEQNWDLQVKFNKLLETKLIEYAKELNPKAT